MNSTIGKLLTNLTLVAAISPERIAYGNTWDLNPQVQCWRNELTQHCAKCLFSSVERLLNVLDLLSNNGSAKTEDCYVVYSDKPINIGLPQRPPPPRPEGPSSDLLNCGFSFSKFIDIFLDNIHFHELSTIILKINTSQYIFM